MFDKTKLRNHGRAAGDPLVSHDLVTRSQMHGSCLQLWKRSDIRDAVHAVLTAPSYPSLPRAVPPPPGPVLRYEVCGACVGFLAEERAAADKRELPRRPPRLDPVLDAWCEMLMAYFYGDGHCFFTGTYRDEYGYPNGLMKPDNVLRDFKRWLKSHDLLDGYWVVCAEPHQERDIWHVHALLGNVTLGRQDELERDWSITRGWAKARPLHDGGIMYATKYALKGQESCRFDWNLS